MSLRRRTWGRRAAFSIGAFVLTVVGVFGCDDSSEPTADVPAPTPRVDAREDKGGDEDVPPPAPEPTLEPEPPLPAAEPTPVAEDAGTCPSRDNDAVGILVNPRRPAIGQQVRILAATLETESPLALRVEGDKPPSAKNLEVVHRPGVPSAVIATLTVEGPVKVVVGRDGVGEACLTIRPKKSVPPTRPRPISEDGVWPVTRAWDRGEEALFSAWVRELFSAPPGEDLAWERFDLVSADASRNVLHNAHGWGEDANERAGGLFLKPDCADLPYFLRAYYAWKRQLPFGFRRCSRGRGKAPGCGDLSDVLGPAEHTPDASRPGEVGAVQKFFRRTLAWGVHSGNGRTALADDDTDFYPVALRRGALRPGTTYADPYGHLFVLVEWVPRSAKSPGILYAVDGQPDGSITRKRFWEGNFLWNPDPTLGGSGFKAFRPHRLGRDGDARVVTVPSNAQLRKTGYDDFSLEQGTLEADQFYDRMDALITPGRRNALSDQEAAVAALVEAAKVRVTSVKNGDAHVARSGEVEMPRGHAIFETTGAWESFSTPARDLRLLIAIDLVRRFDEKVARNRSVYLRKGQTMEGLRTALEHARADLLAQPGATFEYTRSDGSPWTLSVADLLDRAPAFELGYNPNDCPEIRWGAPAGSDERSTCKRRAPAPQQRKMAAYRPWFEKRQRPARGDPGPDVE